MYTVTHTISGNGMLNVEPLRQCGNIEDGYPYLLTDISLTEAQAIDAACNEKNSEGVYDAQPQRAMDSVHICKGSALGRQI
jgi:hypothetical protein